MATQLSIWKDVARFLGDARISTVTDDVELRYALDDCWADAIVFMLRQAPWRFALEIDEMTGTTGGYTAGFTYKHAKPADWLRTHSIFINDNGRECPVDVREYDTQLYSHTQVLKIRYVSTHADDVEDFTEHFSKALASYLAYLVCERVTGDPNRKQLLFTESQQFMAAAIQHDAVPEDPWLVHQLDGSFLSASRAILQQGFWHFAMKTITPSESGSAMFGYGDAYPKPSDWLRTHAIYKLPTGSSKECPVDAREHGAQWSANEAIRVRYISSDGLVSTLWPEEFKRVVGAYLGIDMGDGGAGRTQDGQPLMAWPQYLQRALENIAAPPNPWLTYQLDGSFLPAVNTVLEQGQWKWAIATEELTENGETPSPGYTYAFDKPTAWIRTVQVFQPNAVDHDDIDYRDEDDQFHANYSTIVVRYLSKTLGQDSTMWSEAFTDTVLAYLGWKRAIGSPDTSGAKLRAAAASYTTLLGNSQAKDDMRDRPRVNHPSRLVASRWGGRSSREQG